MDELLSDKRFAHIARDPKFKRIPKNERKVKIDKRFQSMFKDKKFTVQYTVDKRGRPVQETSSENLRKYYDLPSSDEEEEEDEKKTDTHQLKKLSSTMDNIDNQDQSDSSLDNCFSSNGELLRIKPTEENNIDSERCNESESDAESITNTESLETDIKESKKQLLVRRQNESTSLPNKIKEKLRDLSVNYARGEGVLLTDSSSDEESSDDSDEEEIEHNWGELDKEAETTDQITHRLAVCNMDWDRIRAIDLLVLFNSFLPSGGVIRSVMIYPSEFGLQRMKEEEITGPKELTQINNERGLDENDDEEGSTYHMEKLRQYQLNRLKYYYAVVDFDSAETANKVYTECDGTEYESTATKLDLRFIPDDMEFDQTPKEVCNEVPPLSKYQPRQFTTTALQQVKVELTWDETNPERLEIAQKLNSGKLDQLNQHDLQGYLATDSSSDESEEKEIEKESQQNKSDSEAETNADPIEKYKALLKEIEEQEEEKQKKDVGLEFTWGIGTKEKAEKLVKERMKKDANLTPFEQYLEKRKEKKKANREERKNRQNADKDISANSEDSGMSDSDASEIDRTNTNYKSSSSANKKTMKNDNFVSSDNEDEAQRKAELELLLMDGSENNGKQHFNMKKIEENATMTKSKQKRLNKKKNKQDQIMEDNFEVNVQDSRFNALFTSHHFNIDPADPHYRRTKGTEALIIEKLKRRTNDTTTNESGVKQPKLMPNAELQTLVKSVKRNTKNILRAIK
ncbi:ESF1 homolog [Hylaeus anthracinus]|uniref:ESF1 homolog n=1 Tax=Hylaeus anthracinus TaxID=313031 RepID=UPI0023B98422|nr:ESF1 homolog [Hylaeus anthracinus]XP_054013842.1 ESF1 homolog [Hylaeus anthracinus]